ncbi:hypothetical protein AAEU32_09870 [Pseudoalteromonas sp. SSDWG2]|uniref:hypothetical protein n=1 Tax=Pseudoalteromonas sp. SSDWG2 TaxID=3139391 RepID=UPI003BABB6D1
MSDSEIEKLKLEHEAARLFLRAYERKYHTPMRHIWHNEPAKPDVSCYMDNERLDIEIAHLYANEHEAMAVLGRPLNLDIQRQLAQLALNAGSEQLHVALTRLLAAKATKRYDSQRVWLLIRNASTLWHHDDFVKTIGDIDVPQGHVFEQIWLLSDWHAKETPILLWSKDNNQT